MPRKKSSEPKVKLQQWVSAAQAAAIKAYLQGGALHAPAGMVVKSGALPADLAALPRQEVAERIAGAMAKNSMATPLVDTGVAAKMKHLEEQLALQAARADGLQVQLEEEQQCNNRLALANEQLMQTGGTERQSAYIAKLQAQVAALGGKKSEFDQEAK